MQKNAYPEANRAGADRRAKFEKPKQFYHAASASASFKHRKLPPYAKTAVARLATHPGPLTAVDLRIYTGRDAWKRAGSRNKPTLCLPPGENPTSYSWDLVKGCEPWIIETGNTPDSVLQRLSLELLTAGALVVRLSFLDGTNRRMAVFRQGGAHG